MCANVCVNLCSQLIVNIPGRTQMHEIPFNVQTPVAEDASTASATTKCTIAIQKETPAGLVDTICHKDIEKDQAGMCR